MKKWTYAIAAVAATASLIGVGTQAQAQVDNSPFEVGPGEPFTVEYDCGGGNEGRIVNFSFPPQLAVEGVCDNTGMATGSFVGPPDAGTYNGEACLNLNDQPVALRSGLRFTGEQPECSPFIVTVVDATTTIAPTTIAPTTIAPTTTLAVGAVPPAPTTTVAIQLPETGPDRTDGGIVIALALLAIGGGLIVATRWRKDTTPS